MNRWSGGIVRAVSGDGTAPGDTRTVRVRTWGVSVLLEEEVVAVEAPVRFVYRVVRGGGLRAHRGEQVLTPSPGGCTLTWTVEFAAWVPGAEWIQAAVLRPAMETSLDRLEGIVRRA